MAGIVETRRGREFPPALTAGQRDLDQQVGKALASLQLFGELVQAGVEAPIFPRRPRNQLDERLSIGIVGLAPEREGEARRHPAHAPRRIDLPQPVGLVFFEFAQQQRDDLVPFGHARLSHFAAQEGARDLDRADADENPEHRHHRGADPLALVQEAERAGAADHACKNQRATRHRSITDQHPGHQHRGHRPQRHTVARITVLREDHHRQRPDDGCSQCAHGLVADFGRSKATALGIFDAPVDLRAIGQRQQQRDQPGPDQQQRCSVDEQLNHQQRGQRVRNQPGHRHAPDLRILHAAQPPPIAVLGLGQAKHRQRRQALGQIHRAGGDTRHARCPKRRTFRKGKRGRTETVQRQWLTRCKTLFFTRP